MRERVHRRRLTGVAAVTLAMGVLGAPGAMAQGEDPWAGSAFTAPSDDAPATESSFPIAGTFVNSRQSITTVTVDFGRLDDDVYSPAEGDPCVPADPGIVPDTPGNGLDRYDFTVQTPEGDDIVWPCNGRYLIRATAASEGLDGSDEHTLSRTVVVAVAPPPVRSVTATPQGEKVEVTWQPVDDPSADALGYRVERAGPKNDGTFGPYIAVSGDLGTAATSATDRPQVSGEYRYRVLSLRHGADGPVTAPKDASATADAGVTVSTPTTASGTGRGAGTPGRGAPRAPRSSGGARLPASSPPTTLDTGFDEEIDYGNRTATADSPELADGGEGQSIIRSEGEGAGLVAPAAGALVLLGWAGHVVYLNRLAKQF